MYNRRRRMKRLFKISSGEHGKGAVIVTWQPEGNLLATAGHNGEGAIESWLFHLEDQVGQWI